MPSSSSNIATPFRRIASWVFVLGWCAVIFAASDRPDLRVASDDQLDLVLRKTAHVLVYLGLAVLVVRAIRVDRPVTTPTLVASWLLTLAYAVSDEWHQTFVAGRSGQASDVAIDMVGATAAVLLLHNRRTRPHARLHPYATSKHDIT